MRESAQKIFISSLGGTVSSTLAWCHSSMPQDAVWEGMALTKAQSLENAGRHFPIFISDRMAFCRKENLVLGGMEWPPFLESGSSAACVCVARSARTERRRGALARALVRRFMSGANM